MAEMPRPETTRRQQITDYALGIIHESLWILGMCVLAYLMAVASLAVLQ
jgi:hypothetical protein